MQSIDRRRGISIHRAADAADMAETDFMTAPEPPPRGALEMQARLGDDAAAGSELKVLVRDAGGFSLLHVWFKGNYRLPRHTHNVDCMYYVISGSAIMGKQTLRAGDSFFVPAGAPYRYSAGPDGVEVLEVRHGAKQFDIKLLDDGPDQWDALAGVMESNKVAWSRQPVSPTFLANRPSEADAATSG